jgi:hypothetical protein
MMEQMPSFLWWRKKVIVGLVNLAFLVRKGIYELNSHHFRQPAFCLSTNLRRGEKKNGRKERK